MSIIPLSRHNQGVYNSGHNRAGADEVAKVPFDPMHDLFWHHRCRYSRSGGTVSRIREHGAIVNCRLSTAAGS